MLAVSISTSDEIKIGDDIKIVFIKKGKNKDQIVIGVEAPRNIRIERVHNHKKTNAENNGGKQGNNA